jgi:uncharacterized protein YqhQ
MYHGMKHFVPLLCVGFIGTLGVLLGIYLFIIPGIILACIWAVDVPACVAERLGPIKSLSRSAGLTKGYRWKILGILLLASAPLIGIEMLVPNDIESRKLITELASFIFTAFLYVVCPVIYFELRRIKEGTATENLIKVFD